jgi:hypothetical protein
MARHRISDEQRLLDEARRAFPKLVELSQSYQMLFFTDWERMAKAMGKNPGEQFLIFLKELCKNRLAAASAQKEFCFAYRKLMELLKKHERWNEIRAVLPSTIELFDARKHELNAIAFPNVERAMWEDLERSVHIMNHDFVRWACDVVKESTDGRVNPMDFVPDESLFNVNSLIQPLLFDDIVVTGEAQLYFFEQVLRVIEQGISGQPIVAPRYEAERMTPATVAR